MLTGDVPVSGCGIAELLAKVQQGDFPKPSAKRPDINRPRGDLSAHRWRIEPAARYQSAAALAEDIESWLADEPVTAWPEPFSVRARRWLRRHKTFALECAAQATVVAICILSGSLLVLQQKNRAVLAEWQRAEGNLAIAKRAVDTMLTKVGHDRLADVPQFEQTRRELLAKAREFYEQLARQQAADAAVQLEVALSWRRIADIDRITRDVRTAESHYRQSIDLLRNLVDRQPEKTAPLQNSPSRTTTSVGSSLRLDPSRRSPN